MLKEVRQWSFLKLLVFSHLRTKIIILNPLIPFSHDLIYYTCSSIFLPVLFVCLFVFVCVFCIICLFVFVCFLFLFSWSRAPALPWISKPRWEPLLTFKLWLLSLIFHKIVFVQLPHIGEVAKCEWACIRLSSPQLLSWHILRKWWLLWWR